MSEQKTISGHQKVTAIFIIAILLTTPFYGLGQKKVSLAQAVDSALTNNQQIQQYFQQVQQKKYMVKSAKGNRLLSVTASGGYTYLNKNPEINMARVENSVKKNMKIYAGTIAQSGIIPTQDLLQFGNIMQAMEQLPLYNITVDQDNYPNLNITAIQPIYTGGKINAGIRYAKADLNQSEQELQQIKNQVIRETIKNYYSVVLMKEVVKTRENVVSGMKKHLSQAEKAFQIGLIPSQDVLRAQVAVANAEQALEDDQNKLKLAKLALNTNMGKDMYSAIEPADNLHFFKMPTDLTNFQNEALNQQPVLKIIDQKKIMIDQKKVKDRSAFLPQIAAFGTYSAFNKDNPIAIPPFIVGVQAKINLFSGLKKFNQLKATQHMENQVKSAKNYAAEQIKLWVNKSYLNAIANQNKYQRLKPTVELSERSLHITEKRFQEGLSKSIDVIDSYLLNEKIELEELHALYDYYISLSDLYMATGHTKKAVELLQLSSGNKTNHQ
ncbi:MAG: TolC family protein [Bacteroidales bacterium]|nr:TolC family protein [Bacteroidales bacterium]